MVVRFFRWQTMQWWQARRIKMKRPKDFTKWQVFHKKKRKFHEKRGTKSERRFAQSCSTSMEQSWRHQRSLVQTGKPAWFTTVGAGKPVKSHAHFGNNFFKMKTIWQCWSQRSNVFQCVNHKMRQNLCVALVWGSSSFAPKHPCKRVAQISSQGEHSLNKSLCVAPKMQFLFFESCGLQKLSKKQQRPSKGLNLEVFQRHDSWKLLKTQMQSSMTKNFSHHKRLLSPHVHCSAHTELKFQVLVRRWQNQWGWVTSC